MADHKRVTPNEKEELINRFRQKLLPLLSTVETELGIVHAEMGLQKPSGEKWLTLAGKAIHRVARAQELFTVDDVWAELGEGDADDKEYRSQMGVAFRLAKKEGVMVMNGTYSESIRPSRHRSPIRVWRSLLRTR